MDRLILAPGAIPLDTDGGSAQRNAMIAIGYLMQAAFGSGTVVDGLAITQTTVASMTVNIGQGSIISLSTIDATAFGSLALDSDPLIKMGINPFGVTPFTLTAPVTSGQSINYLIEATLAEADGTPVILPYYNAANPAVPYSGPANSGVPQNTVRTQRCSLQLKAGASATTGTQTTPSVDAGWTGLYVVTVNFGQTSITTANLVGTVLAGAPFLQYKIPQLRPGFVGTQTLTGSGNWTVPNDVTSFDVETWGGGGGSGGVTSPGGGSGGGGGGYCKKTFTGQTPGALIAYSVGPGGTLGAASGGNGGAGGNTTFGSVTAGGGSGGPGNSAAGALGGTASGGDINIQGRIGTGTVVITTSQIMAGSGGGSPRGGGSYPGGTTASLGAFAGSTGTFPGGGAAAAASSTGSGSTPAGAAGAAGTIIVRW